MPKRRRLRTLLWSVALCTLAFGPAITSAQAGHLDAKLKAKAGGPSEMVRIIVQTAGKPSPRDHAAVRAYGGETGPAFAVIDGFPARVPSAALKGLAHSPRFVGLSFDAPMKPFYDVNPASYAVGAFGARSNYGVDGLGVRVAVIDSGIAREPDFSYHGGSAIDDFVDFIDPSNEFALDPYGHGTHVSGVIAGNGSVVGDFTGIAPGAKLIGLRVLDATGSGTVSNVLAALDWVKHHADDFNLRVVNLSLGHPVFESYTTDPLCLAISSLVERGIVVVASAGNYGRLEDGTPVYESIVSPGNSPHAITVGAMNPGGTYKRSDDLMASFSSKGPTAIDNLLKPDLVAPGVFTVSLMKLTSYIREAYPDLEVDSAEYGARRSQADYFLLSGTSMATATVSGIVALMLEANPALTPNLVKAALMYTAEDRGYDVMTQGAGYVNAMGAVEVASKITGSPDSYEDGAFWLNAPFSGESTVAGEAVLWTGRTLWGNALLWGGFGVVAYNFEDLWDQAVLWGGVRAFDAYDLGTLGIDSDAIFWTSNYLTADAVLWTDLRMQDIVYGEGFTWNGGKGGGGNGGGGGNKK